MRSPTVAGRVRWLLSTWGSFWLLAGCGGEGDNGTGTVTGASSGTVTETWAGFCTATFTEDTPVLDAFGDPTFTARAGQEYLLTEYGETAAEIAYLAAAGPDTFYIDADPPGAFPFTSNCILYGTVEYYAVFTDVEVYADEALTMKVCDLGEGTLLPAESASRGFAIAGDSISLTGPHTYEVFLNAFGPQCGGLASGYISVPETSLFGARTWLVPIIGIIGPA